MVQLGMKRASHWLRYVISWVLMLLIAIANGAFRQLTFGRVMPELCAHQLSTVIGSVLIGLFIWAIVHLWPPASARQALSIGLAWLSLTVAFEFLFGRFVMHHPWSQLFNDYNVIEGRVWAVFLIWLTLAPYLFFRIHHAR
ncbi:MAG: hypothetical protein ACLPX5_03540 [Dissulfurispiraceae bacterium]